MKQLFKVALDNAVTAFIAVLSRLYSAIAEISAIKAVAKISKAKPKEQKLLVTPL